MLIKQLAAGTAIAALLSTTALAGTAVKTDAQMEAGASSSSISAEAETGGVKDNLNEAAEATGDAASAAVDNAAEMASDAGQAIENTAEDAAKAAANTANDVANAAENTAKDAAQAAENAADSAAQATENTANDLANAADNAVPDQPRFTSVEEMTVGDVVGMIAYDPEEERVGEIDYVLLENGEATAVIGIGGLLGLAEYTVALPMEQFELSEDGTYFTVSASAESLKEQPEFDETGVEGLPHDTSMAEVMAYDKAPADSMEEPAGGS